MRRLARTGLVLLLLAAGGGWAWRATLAARQEQAPQVAVTAVTRGPFEVTLPMEGVLQSDDALTVSTGKAPGELTMIVPDGTVVKAGEVFCRIEARELQRKQTDAQLAYQQANEEIGRARESAEERYDNDQRAVEQAQRDFDVWQESGAIRTKQAEDQLAFDRAEAERLRVEYARTKKLAAHHYVPSTDEEAAQASYDAQVFKVQQSEKDLETNRRQIESERRQKESQAQAVQRRATMSFAQIKARIGYAQRHAEVAAKELDSIALALKDTTVLAPVAGTVSVFSTFRGGERRAWREGDQVGRSTPLGSISGSQNMSVRCRVKEGLIGSLKKGQPAEIEFDSLAGRTFHGTVSSVGVVAREVRMEEDPTAQPGARVFDVMVRLDPTSKQGLKPGLNARARVRLKTLPNVLFLPLEAVFEAGGVSFVYVKQGERFVRREVQTGERTEVAVVIRTGLSGGETVALSDPTRVRTGKEKKSA